MIKTFQFSLYDGSRLHFSLPTINGQLVANRFMPQFLAPGADWTIERAISPQLALVDPAEFERDCRTIVDYFNKHRLQTNLDTSYMDALIFMLFSHINQYGRLFYSDLCAYINEMTNLMYGYGFDEDHLKSRTYPQMAYIAINCLKDDVKDGSPNNMILFTNTAKWQKLKVYCQARHL